VLALVASVWAVVWVAQSPLFSVASITVEGARRAAVDSVLADVNVVEGRPLVLIRPGTVELALEKDPWVKEAAVRRRFPDGIEIRIVERVEVASVPAADGWRTVSDDGHIMVAVSQPPAGLAQVTDEVAVAGAGGTRVSGPMLGVVEFLAALPPGMLGEAVISASGDELVAAIAGHRIRLGTPTNMAAKAAALTAVLADSRLAPDAVIDLIAPDRPSVHSPPPAPASDPAATG
jgi:cell division protein FtsQ